MAGFPDVVGACKLVRRRNGGHGKDAVGEMMFQKSRRLNFRITIALVVLGGGMIAFAQTTRPASQPATTRPSSVLEPVKEGTTRPSEIPAAQFGDAVLLTDLVGHLAPEKDGGTALVFQFGGRTLRMPLLPNSYLARMEATAASNPSMQFRLTGRTTSYRGHNYLLIEDAAIVSDEH